VESTEVSVMSSSKSDCRSATPTRSERKNHAATEIQFTTPTEDSLSRIDFNELGKLIVEVAAGLRGSPRAWFPRTGLPTGTQNKGGPPKEFRGRRPPPSTSSPCPAWFFRLRRPFFRRGETAVQKRLAPVQLLPERANCKSGIFPRSRLWASSANCIGSSSPAIFASSM